MLKVGGKPKVDHTYHPSAQRQNYCVFKAQKQPQCMCQAMTVVGSSLTPNAALLVCSSGTIYSYLAVEHHEFIGSEKCCL